MEYTINPQDGQDSVVSILRAKFPGIPVIPDGLPEGMPETPDHEAIRFRDDGGIEPFILLWFRTPKRTEKGRSFVNSRLDMRKTGADVVVVAHTGGESRRILNGVMDFLVNERPVRAGRITEAANGLWSDARALSVVDRPARWLTTATIEWVMNSQKIA